MTFEVGQRIRTTRIDYADYAPVWHVGFTGTIQMVDERAQYANVIFDQQVDANEFGYHSSDNSDIVNFDEMEVI